MNETNALQVISPQLPIGSFEAYIHRLNQVPYLTHEQELDLSKRFKENGELEAAHQLVLAHLRYVVRVSKGYMGYGLPLADLVQEGTVGLMKAVKRFDPNVGVRLVSFAVHWIKAEIHEYILKNWRIVKIATTKAQRKLFFNLRSAKKRLGWSTQLEVEALASDLGVSTKEVRRMEERLNARDAQFDLPSDMDSSSDRSHQALVPSEYLEDAANNPELLLENDNWDEHTEASFKTAFKQLDPRSQDILQKRWLLEDKSTLKDLADTYSVSPERIRQLENNAIDKLRTLIGEAA